MPSQELTHFLQAVQVWGQVGHELEGSVGCSESSMPGWATNQEVLL